MAAPSDFDLRNWFQPHRAALEAWLLARVDGGWPESLTESLKYPLQSGGKRIRPALCIAAAEAVGGARAEALFPVAGALELVHTYSLVHDDLPAMDNADLRRGNPTVHRKFGEAAAILCGDGLLTEAFAALAAAPLPAETRVALVQLLADAAGFRGMVGGQAADIGMGGTIGDVDTLARLHHLKTGALLRASVLAGATLAGASPSQMEALARYGEHVGLAFQLADDLLDEDEDKGHSGPPSFVRLLGPAATRARAEQEVEAAILSAEAAVESRATVLIALARFIVDRTV
jgi:geranylgeranyl diphosphate synthase type II